MEMIHKKININYKNIMYFTLKKLMNIISIIKKLWYDVNRDWIYSILILEIKLNIYTDNVPLRFSRNNVFVKIDLVRIVSSFYLK